MKILVFIICSVLGAGFLSTSYASKQDCYGGQWELLENLHDIWGMPPDSPFTTPGFGPFWFWEQPTSCTDIVYEEEYKIEYTKNLVCIQPSYTKIQEAPEGGNCVITGQAIPQDIYESTNNPCLYFDGMYSSDYGVVTTAKSMNKYEWVCPPDIIPEKNNLGPPTCE